MIIVHGSGSSWMISGRKNLINSFLALTEGQMDLSGDAKSQDYHRRVPSQRSAKPQEESQFERPP